MTQQHTYLSNLQYFTLLTEIKETLYIHHLLLLFIYFLYQIIIQNYKLQLIMNITNSHSNKIVVSLQQLVPQHDCLKLLILHTPYTLIIDSLNLCINLVKLDLSKNNIESFPYVGDLRNLKVMFIHENRLDVSNLKNIFEKNKKKSFLSENIVWVTFWGNKNAFLGRHYLANETSAIAVDKNLVVQEQKSSASINYFKYESFSQETDISSFFTKKSIVNRFSSQEEYMKQLWFEMSQLRKKHEFLFPIIKIQKVFRGWLVRHKNILNKEDLIISVKTKKQFFVGWKNFHCKTKKLKFILQKSRKEFLLLQRKQMIKKQIYYKIVQIARQVKRKIYYRKLSLKSQMRFYGIVLHNYLVLKNLYNYLQLQKSSAIYIYKQNWQTFSKYIVPFTYCFSTEKIRPLKNQKYCLNNLYEHSTNMTKETIKILKNNTKSLLTQIHNRPISRKLLKGTIFPTDLKPIYQGAHISTLKQFQIKDKMQGLQKKIQFELDQLIKIQGSLFLLKTMTRGIFFYNTNRLTQKNINIERIVMLSQRKIIEITSAVKIQRVWRGYIFRKKNNIKLNKIIRMQRAAIIIQRWVRKMPNYQKSCFIYRMSKKLNKINENSFFIEFTHYLRFLDEQKTTDIKNIIFPQQDIILCINKQNKNLSLSWNINSFDPIVRTKLKHHKLPFNIDFLTSKVEISTQQLDHRFIFEQQEIQPCLISYLFHYQTKTNLITKNKSKYLQILCESRRQVKWRLWIIALLSFTIKNKQTIPIKENRTFKYNEIDKKNMDNLSGHFICNENFALIKTCQAKFMNNTNMPLYAINNKCYFTSTQNRPIKAEEKFFIYLNSNEQLYQNVEIQIKKGKKEAKSQQQRYRTQFSEGRKNLEDKKFLLTEHNQRQSMYNNFNSEKVPIDQKSKSIMRKKSVKRYKIQKRNNKQKKNDYLSFVLDSFSINERFLTQPDRVGSQNSLQHENNLNMFNSIQNQKDNVQGKKKLQQKLQINIKKRASYVQKKTHYFKSKEEDFFLKKFVNLGNFIQNQYSNEHRRRIKTEIEVTAAESAQNVRKQLRRTQSQRAEQSQERHIKIRENHNKHRQLVQKSKALTKDYSLRLKNEVLSQKTKKMREKPKIKRLKVSFAEECFPLVLRSKKNHNFP